VGLSNGPAAAKKAIVAVARELSVLLHRPWVAGEVYQTLRASTLAAAA
jgi:hypothetical protein